MQKSFAEKVQRTMEFDQVSSKETDIDFIQALPQTFKQFMSERFIPLHEIATPIPRYIRIKPGTQIKPEDIAADLKLPLESLAQVD